MPIRVADLVASIELSPLATVITDPRQQDNPIVAVNTAFTALTGYPAEEVLGRNCRFLSCPDADPAARDRLRRAITAGEPVLVELRNRRRDGSSFVNAVMIAPVLEDDGSLAFYVGSQMEVAETAVSAARMRSRELVAGLTVRQRQVLDSMMEGQRNKQIARLLGIDEKTVKMHRAALLSRLGVASSAEAIRIGLEATLA